MVLRDAVDAQLGRSAGGAGESGPHSSLGAKEAALKRWSVVCEGAAGCGRNLRWGGKLMWRWSTMRGRTVGWLMMTMMLVLVPAGPAPAWGPGGHVVVAMAVAEETGASVGSDYLALQALYGAAAPDIAWRAEEPLRSALGAAMHDEPGYRAPWDLASPWSSVQRAFAWGWLTHNQVWGADYYAHIGDPFEGTWPAAGPGYVVERAALLASSQGIPEEVAHNYVEVGIDLLLDQQFPGLALGRLLRNAASYRDGQVPLLLVRSYADVPGAGRWTIRATELEFRLGLAVYGEGLSWPTGQDDAAFAAGMALSYGLTGEKSAACLGAAKALCREPGAHYLEALEATVELVAGGPWP